MGAKERAGLVVEDVERGAGARVDLEELGLPVRDQEVERDEADEAELVGNRDAGRDEARLEIGIEREGAGRAAVAVGALREGGDPLPAHGEGSARAGRRCP